MLKVMNAKNTIEFKLTGKYALFTDPVTKIGGEKFSYHVPTYEAIKGVLKSIYWKPTFIWYVDKVRVMKPLRTQAKGMKPIKYHTDGNELSIYTYLHDVEYQVKAHFEWNEYRPELEQDRNDGKHFNIAKRMLEKGGRQDIFLGVRDCQGYVEPCMFGEEKGAYDDIEELGFGMMFHSFGYPDETGKNELEKRLWNAVMKKGVIEYPRPEECKAVFVRQMTAKQFDLGKNVMAVGEEETRL